MTHLLQKPDLPHGNINANFKERRFHVCYIPPMNPPLCELPMGAWAGRVSSMNDDATRIDIPSILHEYPYIALSTFFSLV